MEFVNQRTPVKGSCEKHIKDSKNTRDRLKSEANGSIEWQRTLSNSPNSMRMEICESELDIFKLKETIENREQETGRYIETLDVIDDFNQGLVQQSHNLKRELATTFAQGAIFRKKLDQTSDFGTRQLDDTRMFEEQHLKKIETFKVKSNDESDKFQQLLANFENGAIDTALKQLKIEMEKKHVQEMQELRMYFEWKCLQMKKQFYEDVYSKKSKKVSDDNNEIEVYSGDDAFLDDGSTNDRSYSDEDGK